MKTFALIQTFLSLVAPNDYVLQDNIMQYIQANTDYTFYEFTTYMPSLEEIKELENNTFGVGKKTEKIKDYIYPGVTHFFDSEKYPNSEQRIIGVISFYGPYDNVIAYEYIISCGDNVCGSLYSVFPGINGENDGERAMQKLDKNFECKNEYYCDHVGHIDMYGIKTFRVPDITPASYRISKLGKYSGKIKFYHGIYGLDTENNKIYSLDRDDKDLTKDDIIKRLKELANPDNYSFTLGLLKEKSIRRKKIKDVEEEDKNCDKCYIIEYDHKTEVESSFKINHYMKKEGYFDIPAVLTGSYKILDKYGSYVDIITGRALEYGIMTYGITHYDLSL